MSEPINNTVISALMIVSLIAFAGLFAPTASHAVSEDIDVELSVGDSDDDTDDEDDDQQVEDTDTSRPGQSAALLLDVADISATQDSITITWETTVQAQSEVRWSRADGTGESYVQASQRTGRTHTTRITGLESGTRYQVELTAEAVTGERKTATKIIRTDLPDGPQSPNNFQVNVTADNNVRMTWDNPDDSRFDYVRVTRSSDFFADEPLRGQLIYEGQEGVAVDDAVTPGQTYFYSIYSRYQDGRWSAPSLRAVYVPDDGAPDGDAVSDIVADQPDAPEETQQLLSDLTFSDLIFSQNETVVENGSGEVSLVANRPFSVGFEYDALPDVLKTVLVTLEDPDNPKETFSFVLRANESKNFYKATVGGLEKAGTYGVEVTILDYKYRRVKTLRGQLSIQQENTAVATSTGQTTIGQLGEFGSQSDGFNNLLLILLLLLLLGLGIITIEYYIVRKRDQAEIR